MRAYLFLLICGFWIFAPVTSQAQAEPASESAPLTEKIITDYLDTMAALYTFEKPDLEKILDYAHKHIDPEAHFVIENHVNDMLDPMIEKYNYDQMLAQVEEDYTKAYNTQTKYKIESIKMSEDRESAEIKYHVWMNSAYATHEPQTGRKAEVTFKTYSFCTEHVHMVDNLLKIKDSNCVQDVALAKPVFLE
ncbi:MAG: hypothetical protein H6858_09445 [Rhodospirillales bacterium]|nr:hypothetical protein [Alphaproteobacteria bacterium]MCB9977809.1 hypothetical protein [Rhodospirillales bacterium]